VLRTLQTLGWLACVVYSTIPAFWLLIHPRAKNWRERARSPYRVLIPVWVGMWAVVALVTMEWREVVLYETGWMWVPALVLLSFGIWLYRKSGSNFSAKQLGGVPELHGGGAEQRLVTDGIRARVRHPVYLAHLSELLAWSVGTGLMVCFGLTAFAVITGVIMIRMEDAELEQRFGERFIAYRDSVPAVLPKLN
jgi:protein-S-isoprenylcysteine O-methyltransferase Ste14